MAGTGEKLRKRIFLNLDGTGQSETNLAGVEVNGVKTSPPVSNVARIGRATLMDDEVDNMQQIVYYQSGIGASTELGGIASLGQGMSATGMVENIREAYGFLCNNYDYGDEIYITGFSRGAFTARSVAGMVNKLGILTKKGLDLFYEAYDYYQFPEKYKTRGNPISVAAKTTREYYPPDTDQKIKIRAVGVWDTVGGLSFVAADYAFHDLKLGKHVEHAYHMLALNEQRYYYEPTLWETPNEKLPMEKLEQCWMAGDHSNVGGSWEDTQLADISLAWMMSRFEVLGVKFDDQYIYREFDKYRRYVANDKQKKGTGDPWETRQWGEGASRSKGGEYTRTPHMYKKPELKDGYLQNTNETVHPAVRYRHFCKNRDQLGAEDSYGLLWKTNPYNPAALNGWTWPSAQVEPDGRIGTPPPTSSKDMSYIKDVEGTKGTMPESIMGRYEKMLLALYDQEVARKSGDMSVWKAVMGGEGPPQNIKDMVNQVKNPAPPAAGLYIGTEPLLPADEKAMSPYKSLSSNYRVGSWNGGQGGGSYTCLGKLKVGSAPKSFKVSYFYNANCVSGIEVQYTASESDSHGIISGDARTDSTLTLCDGEKVVKCEVKAAPHPWWEGALMCNGLRLTTTKGNVFSAYNNFDSIDGNVVVGVAPEAGWELIGFYGGCGDVMDRIGPVWGKRC